MSELFSIGVCTAFFGFLLPLVYWLRIGVMGLSAWLHRKPLTQERKGVFTSIFLAVGLIFGSFVQPQYESFDMCLANGKKVAECILNSDR